jgi:hypothetical protein
MTLLRDHREDGARRRCRACHPDRPQEGRLVQVDPIKPTLKAPGTKLLELQYDERLSSFAFNLNLRHYKKGAADTDMHSRHYWAGAYTRPLFSST